MAKLQGPGNWQVQHRKLSLGNLVATMSGLHWQRQPCQKEPRSYTQGLWAFGPLHSEQEDTRHQAGFGPWKPLLHSMLPRHRPLAAWVEAGPMMSCLALGIQYRARLPGVRGRLKRLLEVWVFCFVLVQGGRRFRAMYP